MSTRSELAESWPSTTSTSGGCDVTARSTSAGLSACGRSLLALSLLLSSVRFRSEAIKKAGTRPTFHVPHSKLHRRTGLRTVAKGSGFEQDRHGAVVDQLDRHPGSEDAGRHPGHARLAERRAEGL